MDPETESQMMVVCSSHVESFRRLECCGVTVRGGQQRKDKLTRAHLMTLDLYVVEEASAGELHRRHPAKHLFHSGLDQRRSGPQDFKLIGMLDERQDPPRYEIDRRFVSRDEQQDGRREQLAFSERITPLLGRDELAEKVLTRGPPPLSKNRKEILGEGH